MAFHPECSKRLILLKQARSEGVPTQSYYPALVVRKRFAEQAEGGRGEACPLKEAAGEKTLI